jgi:Spy/CpxP family protein refolding chaperone
MFTSVLNTKAVRVTTTAMIAAFLAVCTLSVAPDAGAAPTAGTSQHAVIASSSGQSTQDDGFHW